MLTQNQVDWMQTYFIAPVAVMDFYKVLVSMGTVPFTTFTETISYDEVKEAAIEAKILPRGMAFPIGKQDGFEKKAVTPDIIKDSRPFSDGDGLENTIGQVYLGGKAFNNKDKKRNERIQKLKVSIEDKSNWVSAEMLFNQTYTPDKGSKISFTKAKSETVASSAIENFSQWALEKEEAYQKANKVYPDYRFIGSDIYIQLVKVAEAKNSQISITKIGSEKIGNTEIQYIVLNAKKYHVLPSAQTAKKEPISTNGLLMFYNHQAIQPAYVGLTNVTNGKATREEIDVLIRETSADEETGYAKTLGESGYIPVLIAPKLIWQIKITGVDTLKN